MVSELTHTQIDKYSSENIIYWITCFGANTRDKTKFRKYSQPVLITIFFLLLCPDSHQVSQILAASCCIFYIRSSMCSINEHFNSYVGVLPFFVPVCIEFFLLSGCAVGVCNGHDVELMLFMQMTHDCCGM